MNYNYHNPPPRHHTLAARSPPVASTWRRPCGTGATWRRAWTRCGGSSRAPRRRRRSNVGVKRGRKRGKPWGKYGKIWGNYGKLWETMGKLWENQRKLENPMRFCWGNEIQGHLRIIIIVGFMSRYFLKCMD